MELAVDAPSLMVIQALECLQHYWFGIGQPHAGNLCLALAYRSCQLLGYKERVLNENGSTNVSFESELGRRCFWACWTSTCIVMEPEPYIESSWREVAMVPLPAAISYTSSGCEITLNEKMDGNWHSISLCPRTGTDRSPVTAACLMKMIGVWSKVQLLAKHWASSLVAQDFDSALRLSHLATSLYNDADTLRNSASPNHTSYENQTLLLVHDALYHQCQITLHSMIVPLFSGIPFDPKIDHDTQRKSAETVIKHPDLFEGLLAHYLYGRGDVSCLPPLVGYGAFVVGIVLLATEISCENQEVNGPSMEAGRKSRRIVAVEAISQLLDKLRVYWRALQRPWEKLHAALQTDLSAFKKRPKPTDPEDTYPSDGEPPRECGRSDEPMNFSNEQPPSLATEKGTGEGLAYLRRPRLAGANDTEQEGPSEMRPGDPLMGADYDWYSLSFAEAGVEQFAGLEPSTLFQQGWSSFT